MLPEEQELARLTAEQDSLADQVSAAELALETERTETLQFQRRYYDGVGKYYAELDALDAELAALQAAAAQRTAQRAAPDPQAQAAAEATARAAEQSAAEAADKARASASEAGLAEAITPVADITPEIKATYRRACKLMHPDRATTDPERLRRTEYMAQVNVAYERGDQFEIERLIAEFGADPEAIAGHDVGTQMVKAIRRIAQLRRRLVEIESHYAEFANDDLVELRRTVVEAETLGGNPLGDLAVALLKQISERRISIEILRGSTSKQTL